MYMPRKILKHEYKPQGTDPTFPNFYIFLPFFIHPSILNITNITPYSPDDGSTEPKFYSVDFISL